MADHFFAIEPAVASNAKPKDVAVATSSASGVGIELRVTDLECKRIQVLQALEFLIDMIGSKNPLVVPINVFKD